jgi:hypothetical protein
MLGNYGLRGAVVLGESAWVGGEKTSNHHPLKQVDFHYD